MGGISAVTASSRAPNTPYPSPLGLFSTTRAVQSGSNAISSTSNAISSGRQAILSGATLKRARSRIHGVWFMLLAITITGIA
jgi:hypothetical protein